MAIQPLPKKPVFDFVIPSLTKDKVPIPKEKIEEFIAAIEGKAYQKNDGFYKILNCRGGYRSKDGKIYYEDNMVIRTYGENPLTKQQLSFFAKYLDQDCLFVLKTGECQAYLYDGADQPDIEYYHEDFPDNSMVKYYREISEDGSEVKYYHEYYDEIGEIRSAGEISEGEIMTMIEDGDQAILNMLAHFEKQ